MAAAVRSSCHITSTIKKHAGTGDCAQRPLLFVLEQEDRVHLRNPNDRLERISHRRDQRFVSEVILADVRLTDTSHHKPTLQHLDTETPLSIHNLSPCHRRLMTLS